MGWPPNPDRSLRAELADRWAWYGVAGLRPGLLAVLEYTQSILKQSEYIRVHSRYTESLAESMLGVYSEYVELVVRVCFCSTKIKSKCALCILDTLSFP